MEKEQQYLDFVFKNLQSQLNNLETSIEKTAKQIEYLLGFISDTFTDMDDEEAVTTHDLLNQEDIALSQMQEHKDLLELQKQKPYFARVDFLPKNQTEVQKIYIGRGSIVKQDLSYTLVSDWRAPISSVFYDYELGTAEYMVDDDKIKGEVKLKRQYKLNQNKLEYFFDTSIMVYDEILQKELSVATSGQMKTIVATIQKEQNQIIRNEKSQNLIVQGVAGSGKTAIALHRIAYLLYKHKNLISSNEIMILSPNNLFSHYISNVLPSLGEKNVLQSTFLEIAKHELGTQVFYESRTEMVERLLLNKETIKIVNVKESFDFIGALDDFLKHFTKVGFMPKKLKVGKNEISKELIQKLYFEVYSAKSPAIRLEWMTDYILDEISNSESLKSKIMPRVKDLLYSMFSSTDILRIYREFLFAVGLPDISGEKVFYDDIPALLYIKNYMFSLERLGNIKHLVIDEMQDFSPLALKVLEIIFPCAKTILGDINQTLFKTLNAGYLQELKNFLPNTQLIELEKSYRSTKQITQFSAKLLGIQNISHINREGQEVSELALGRDELAASVLNFVISQKAKGHGVAIICETEKQAQELFIELFEIEGLVLITDEWQALPDEGECLIMSVAMSKGLEFDSVLAVSQMHKTNIGKSLLYVAATRALHALEVVYL